MKLWEAQFQQRACASAGAWLLWCCIDRWLVLLVGGGGGGDEVPLYGTACGLFYKVTPDLSVHLPLRARQNPRVAMQPSYLDWMSTMSAPYQGAVRSLSFTGIHDIQSSPLVQWMQSFWKTDDGSILCIFYKYSIFVSIYRMNPLWWRWFGPLSKFTGWIRA